MNKTTSTEISNGASCIFCKIVKGEIPAEKVYEDEVSLAFLDINPVSEGHVLLIPKEHHKKMEDTPESLVGELFIRVKRLIPKIQKATQADFVVNTVVGIDVPHFHIHVIPRFNDDGLGGFWPAKKYESPEKMEEVGNKIRKETEKVE